MARSQTADFDQAAENANHRILQTLNRLRRDIGCLSTELRMKGILREPTRSFWRYNRQSNRREDPTTTGERTYRQRPKNA